MTASAEGKGYLSLQLADRELFVGTIDSCGVYPRDVVRSALLCNAVAGRRTVSLA